MASFGIYLLVLGVLGVGQSASADGVQEADSSPYKVLPTAPPNTVEYDISYWQNQALKTLDKKLQKLNENKAKNIIFFLGDGMSVATTTAARIYKGQLINKTGEEGHLFFEKFPFVGLSKTYCTDRQVPDSACTATAYMTGVKTNFRGIGVTAKVKASDCQGARIEANRPSSILQWAQEAGKGTGVVTTTRVTHASPAGSYAHISYREFECDSDIETYKMTQTCNDDIARQLVEDNPGKNIKVILGGGRDKFLPKRNPNSTHGTGSRIQKDLIETWKRDKATRKVNAAYVTDANSFDKVNPQDTDYLLGLFNTDHMNYHLDDAKDEPPLWKMTEKAIQILQKEEKGFFLFVEGGRIDQAHHDVKIRKALDETLEFDKAIELAVKMTNEDETLIVVTADHAHTMTINGYPARGNNILGLYGKSKDGLPYATLSYANGPGYHKEAFFGTRYNLNKDNMADKDYLFPAMVPKDSETHGGDDVAVYARGPWAHLFTGNYEQNYIPIAEAYAAQIGPAAAASRPDSDSKSNKNSAGAAVSISPGFLSFSSAFLLAVIVKLLV